LTDDKAATELARLPSTTTPAVTSPFPLVARDGSAGVVSLNLDFSQLDSDSDDDVAPDTTQPVKALAASADVAAVRVVEHIADTPRKVAFVADADSDLKYALACEPQAAGVRAIATGVYKVETEITFTLILVNLLYRRVFTLQ
jgi:hypothetical protein